LSDIKSRETISSKGWKGTNLDDAYTEQKRGYDATMVGKFSLTTPTDAGTGIKRTLTANANVINARGFADREKSLKDMNNFNMFSMDELLTVNTTIFDDPYRTSMTSKQSTHAVPVKNGVPALISNGADEALPYMVSSTFSIVADEDGEIVEIDAATGYAIVKYDSGKIRAINLNNTIENNSAGGFFIESKLKLNEFEVGQKVLKNDILAYNPDFFTASKLNGVRYNIGSLAKVAIMSTYNTYQDAGVYTKKVAEDLTTKIIYKQDIVLSPWANIQKYMPVGSEVKVHDALLSYQMDKNNDSDMSDLLEDLIGGEDLLISKLESTHPGQLIKMELFCTVDLDELSDSLAKFVSDYYKRIDKKNKLLNKYDPHGNVIKCGEFIKETGTKTTPDKYGNIQSHYVGKGVLINFYIEHDDPIKVGDKVCLFTANKTIVSEVTPEGYEPYSEFRKDEEISGLVAESAILNRMTPSVLVTAATNKVLIELKKKLQEIYNS
jgi:DNA-directed RNA polymerase beta subunit